MLDRSPLSRGTWMLVLAVGCAQTPPPPMPNASAPPIYREQDGVVAIEAERPTAHDGFQVVPNSEASGGAVLVLGPQPPMRVDYPIELRTGGRYHLWMRYFAANQGENGIFIELDGKKIAAPDEPRYKAPRAGQPGNGRLGLTMKAWSWRPFYQTLEDELEAPVVFDAAAGPHVITLNGARRERPFVDKIVLTTSDREPLGLGPAQTRQGEGPFVEEGGVVSIETENFRSADGGETPFRRVSRQDASGGAGVVLGSLPVRRAHYRLALTKGGRYHVWIRHLAKSTTTNSVDLEWNGQKLQAPAGHKLAGSKILSFAVAKSWSWQPLFMDGKTDELAGPVVIDATAGEHTLTIEGSSWERPLIDKVVLTLAPDAPVGMGPAETARGVELAGALR